MWEDQGRLELAYQNNKKVFEYNRMDVKYLVDLKEIKQCRLDVQDKVKVERKVYRIIMPEADAKTIFDLTIDKACYLHQPDTREGNEEKRKMY